jgi:hypothetical protein
MGFNFGTIASNLGSAGVNGTLAINSAKNRDLDSTIHYGIKAVESAGSIIGGKVESWINKVTSFAQNTMQQVQGIKDFASLVQSPQQHQLAVTA